MTGFEQQTIYAMLTVAFEILCVCIKDHVHACNFYWELQRFSIVFLKDVQHSQDQLGEIADIWLIF